MINVTEQVKYGKNNSYESILHEIEVMKINFDKLAWNFKMSPSTKTATPLSKCRVKIDFLKLSLTFTTKYKEIQDQKGILCINNILDIIAPGSSVTLK